MYLWLVRRSVMSQTIKYHWLNTFAVYFRFQENPQTSFLPKSEQCNRKSQSLPTLFNLATRLQTWNLLQPTLSMPPPVTLHFFPLCVLKRCPPLHFERKSKTLKGLSCLGSETGIVACKNIRFSSLFAAGDVSRETSPAVKSEGETDAFAGYRHRKSVWISMITGITTASPIKVVVPHKHVSKPFELAPTLLSPVFSSGDTQITVTAAIAIFNLPEENRGLCLWSTILDKTVEKNAYLEGHFF